MTNAKHQTTIQTAFNSFVDNHSSMKLPVIQYSFDVLNNSKIKYVWIYYSRLEMVVFNKTKKVWTVNKHLEAGPQKAN